MTGDALGLVEAWVEALPVGAGRALAIAEDLADGHVVEDLVAAIGRDPGMLAGVDVLLRFRLGDRTGRAFVALIRHAMRPARPFPVSSPNAIGDLDRALDGLLDGVTETAIPSLLVALGRPATSSERVRLAAVLRVRGWRKTSRRRPPRGRGSPIWVAPSHGKPTGTGAP